MHFPSEEERPHPKFSELYFPNMEDCWSPILSSLAVAQKAVKVNRTLPRKGVGSERALRQRISSFLMMGRESACRCAHLTEIFVHMQIANFRPSGIAERGFDPRTFGL